MHEVPCEQIPVDENQKLLASCDFGGATQVMRGLKPILTNLCTQSNTGKQMTATRLLLLPFALLGLSACASSSGVNILGPDTYNISATASPARGGWATAKGIALSEAHDYCTTLGKEVLVTNTTTANTNGLGAGSADVTFRCLSKDDPALSRPIYGPTPNTIIEDRRH